jgi:hypothetical protein
VNSRNHLLSRRIKWHSFCQADEFGFNAFNERGKRGEPKEAQRGSFFKDIRSNVNWVTGFRISVSRENNNIAINRASSFDEYSKRSGLSFVSVFSFFAGETK